MLFKNPKTLFFFNFLLLSNRALNLSIKYYCEKVTMQQLSWHPRFSEYHKATIFFINCVEKSVHLTFLYIFFQIIP